MNNGKKATLKKIYKKCYCMYCNRVKLPFAKFFERRPNYGPTADDAQATYADIGQISSDYASRHDNSLQKQKTALLLQISVKNLLLCRLTRYFGCRTKPTVCLLYCPKLFRYTLAYCRVHRAIPCLIFTLK